jgi:hypothetical protein
MSIAILQTCDVCKTMRELKPNTKILTPTVLEIEASKDGWEPVPEFPHLHMCSGCIDTALKMSGVSDKPNP